MPQHLIALLLAERRPFAAQERRNHVAVVANEVIGRVRAAQLVDRDDEVVLGDRGLARIAHRIFQACGHRATGVFGLPLERFVFDERVGHAARSGHVPSKSRVSRREMTP